MFEQARTIMRGYKQYKTADLYTDNLRPIHEEMYPHIPKSEKTLDIGTAYGVLPLMLSLRGDKVTASDMTKKYTNVQMLKDNGIEWLDLNIEHDKKVPGKYNLVTMTEVIEHLNSSPLPTLKKLYDCLEPGGHIVCSTPAKEIHGTTEYLNDKGVKGLWSDLDTWRDIPMEYKGKWKDQHTFHYDQFELVSLFSEAGFEVVDTFVIAEFSHLIIGRKNA